MFEKKPYRPTDPTFCQDRYRKHNLFLALWPEARLARMWKLIEILYHRSIHW